MGVIQISRFIAFNFDSDNNLFLDYSKSEFLVDWHNWFEKT